MKYHLIYLILMLLMLIAGYGLGSLNCELTINSSVKSHWDNYHDHMKYYEEPSKYEYPKDNLQISLNALVAFQEIEHTDFVLPTVFPEKELNQKWLEFCSSHESILWAEMEIVNHELTISGEMPMHINVWYHTGGVKHVQEMIDVLENHFPNEVLE